MRGQNRFPLIGDKLRNVRTFHPSLHLARISRPVRADAAGHELAAALQHRPDAGAIPLPMMHRFGVQPTLRPSQQPRSQPMTTRHAACSCGQLHLTIEGEPSRISMCHCLECQRRTGAVISNQARFSREQVTVAGNSTTWVRTAESGNADLSLLSHMWLHHVLGEHRLSWIRQCCHRQLCRPKFSRTKHRSVGGVTPPVGLAAAR